MNVHNIVSHEPKILKPKRTNKHRTNAIGAKLMFNIITAYTYFAVASSTIEVVETEIRHINRNKRQKKKKKKPTHEWIKRSIASFIFFSLFFFTLFLVQCKRIQIFLLAPYVIQCMVQNLKFQWRLITDYTIIRSKYLSIVLVLLYSVCQPLDVRF